MQTFLPYPDFADSAAVLDNVRLACQIKEGYQIMQALLIDKGWIHHSVTRMWRGYEWELLLYIDACNKERLGRGRPTHQSMINVDRLYFNHRDAEEFLLPEWFGDPDLHRSHQSNLVRKDPEYYRPYFPDVPDDLEYVWPIKEDNR